MQEYDALLQTKPRRHPRRWRRFTIDSADLHVEPGSLHGDEDCAALQDTDEGCPACIEEMDEASEALMYRLEAKGLTVWDCWFVDKPGPSGADDKFWTFDMLVSKAPEL